MQYVSLPARPSAPRELKVIDMSRNTVQLTWEAPENDGGSPVTGYLIEKRDISRKTWTKVSFLFCFYDYSLLSLPILFPFVPQKFGHLLLWEGILEIS